MRCSKIMMEYDRGTSTISLRTVMNVNKNVTLNKNVRQILITFGAIFLTFSILRLSCRGEGTKRKGAFLKVQCDRFHLLTFKTKSLMLEKKCDVYACKINGFCL